jgi:hypothetical protein
MATKRNSRSGGPSPVAEEAIKRMNIAVEADSGNRAMMLEDLKFSHGEQWPDEIRMQRELDRRPCQTINKTDTFIRSVVNNMRQQRPRIKVHPVADGADQETAAVIEGVFRHIEVQSNADLAYDTAADNQVRMGLGYIRLAAKYVDERSFDQEIYIDRVRNPFSVYFDPSSTQPDGLDAEWVVVVDRIRRDEFKRLYPDASEVDFQPSGSGDASNTWSTREEIMVAEYWRIEYKEDKLFKLANGQTVFKSEVDEGKTVGDFVGDSIIIDERDSCKRVVLWSKVTASQELESREWGGKYIPIIPVYGAENFNNGKIMRYGMVRNLKDPQRMYNYWRTQETEFVALAPKAPWLVAEGQTENHEDEWATANIKNHSTLTWKPVSTEDGQTLPPPQRLAPTPIPQGSVNAAMGASEDLKAVAGMFDPSLGAPGQETSGMMVAQRQQQSDMSNYHFYDNLTRSIRAVGIVMLDLLKVYYTGERVIRIIGEDGNPDTATINHQRADEILNDLTVGRYDVIMETGPGFNTRRQESAASMLMAMQHMPQLGQIAGDLIIGQMDWPGARSIAERLKMANPLAAIQNQVPKDLDPKAQAIVAQLMGQLQQTKQQLQQLQQEKMAKVVGVQEKEKMITDRETMTELAETQRVHMREQAQLERAKLAARTKMIDSQARNATSIQETVIDAQTELDIARLHHYEHHNGGGNHGLHHDDMHNIQNKV